MYGESVGLLLAQFLRNMKPRVKKATTTDLVLPNLPAIAGPPSLGPPASARLFKPQ